MHPVIKSLLRMLGIDPEHPELMLDALASSLGVNPEDFKKLPEHLIGIGQQIDKRLSDVQAALDRIEARQNQIEDKQNVGPGNSAANGLDNDKLGNAIERARSVG